MTENIKSTENDSHASISDVDTIGDDRRDDVPVNNIEANTPEDEKNKPISSEELKLAKKIRTRRILVFIALQLSLFLSALDSTIIVTALPRIGSEFNRMDIISWIATAYILPFDAFQPLFAKFSDIFGRKWILISGIGLFLVGSVLCGASQSMAMLIASRVVAGIGAAGIFSMVFIVISDLIPLEQRGSYQGLINAVFALTSVFGPLIGVSFTDNVSWRWNFYINLPIGAVAIVMLFVFLDLPTPKGNFKEKLKRIDYIGTLIVLISSTLFLLAMNFGGQVFPWSSAAVIVPLVLTVVLVGILTYVEGKLTKEPLMPPRLFKIRTVICVLISNWFFGIAFFSLIFYMPLYFQIVRNDSATWSGIRLIPMQMVVGVGATLTGIFISKTGYYKPLLIIGMGMLTLGIGLLSLLDRYTPFANIYGYTVICGLSLSLLFSSNLIALQAAVEKRDIAVVIGLGNFSQILGGALGVAISSAVLNSSLKKNLMLLIPSAETSRVISSSEYIRNGLPAEYLMLLYQIGDKTRGLPKDITEIPTAGKIKEQPSDTVEIKVPTTTEDPHIQQSSHSS
ncbi:major facilitator superfamily domain-containing protein [Spinellus fusiger]|nr:major facilitator superfamily domain-containing protein [Spinellus fusiger]